MARNKIKRKRDREIKKNKKIDELWLVLIVTILILFVSILTQKNDLEIEAESILNELTDNNNEYSFAQNNVVHEERLEKILDMRYSELKDALNVKNDFCIYFEDEDSNLVEVNGIKSIGSSVIEISGEPCGK